MRRHSNNEVNKSDIARRSDLMTQIRAGYDLESGLDLSTEKIELKKPSKPKFNSDPVSKQRSRLYFYDVWLDTFSQAQRAYSRTIAGHVPSLLEERSNRVLALVLEERAGLFARIALLSIELELSTKAEIVRLNNAMAY